MVGILTAYTGLSTTTSQQGLFEFTELFGSWRELFDSFMWWGEIGRQKGDAWDVPEICRHLERIQARRQELQGFSGVESYTRLDGALTRRWSS